MSDETMPGGRYLVTCINVNQALPQGISLLKTYGHPASPRGKKVLEMPNPVMTHYLRPDQCVLTDPIRLCNPFFHLFEALWILNGRNDVRLLEFFNSGIRNYSDNGDVFHGAYGFRLRGRYDRSRYGFYSNDDQLAEVANKLSADRMSRQAVATIWNKKDLWYTGKDTPCNDLLMFALRENRLNLTVICRSNDIIWGAYGANAVQFSFILQYMAALLGAKVGYMWQFSNNYHVYTEEESAVLWKKLSEDRFPTKEGSTPIPWTNLGQAPYNQLGLKVHPILAAQDRKGKPIAPHMAIRILDDEINTLLSLIDDDIEAIGNEEHSYVGERYEDLTQPFLRNVAVPVYLLWLSHKVRKQSPQFSAALRDQVAEMGVDKKIDWLYAACQWLEIKEQP